MAIIVREQVALGPQTTLKIGGPATYYIEVTTESELEEAVTFAEQKALPFCILGGGSNMLVADEGYRGVIINMRIQGRVYEQINSEMFTVHVGAGEVLDDFISDLVERGLWGLENLSHIPGSVGATPVQNVGAYGVEVADVIARVRVFDAETKTFFVLKNSECGFSYRHSIFKEKYNLIIVSVTFSLFVIPKPNVTYAGLTSRLEGVPSLRNIRDTIIAIRSEKFPDWHTVGTAGSFFKNPLLTQSEVIVLLKKYPDIPTYPASNDLTKVSLGYILDKICGLKGFTIGPVRLYEKQALVLVAEEGATEADIKNFVKIISEKIFLKAFIKISQEVTEI